MVSNSESLELPHRQVHGSRGGYHARQISQLSKRLESLMAELAAVSSDLVTELEKRAEVG